VKLTWQSPFRFAAAMWRALVWACGGRPIITPEKIRLEREGECQVCPHRELDQCMLCSCLLDAKLMLSSEQCPDSPPRWYRLPIKKAAEPQDDSAA